MWRLDGSIERSTHGDCERGSGVDRIKNSRRPSFQSLRSIRPIAFSVLPKSTAGDLVILRRQAAIIDRQLLCLDIRKHLRRLIGTHG